MIIYGNNNLLNKLTELASSPFEFYPTGSRHLGGARQDSDWDFFVEDSNEVRSYLEEIGFTQIFHNRYADDPQIVSLFRFSWSTTSYIDVQVVQDSSKKWLIQQVLDETGALRNVTRSQARIVWRTMYELYDRVSEPRDAVEELADVVNGRRL